MKVIHRHYLYAGDRRIHYRRAGAGAPLVLLPDAPASSFSLEPLIGRLAEWYTVIALDLPGSGESAGPGVQDPRMPDYVDALAETCVALGLDRFLLYGAGTGAAIALWLALGHPEMVRRLVLDGLPLWGAEERRDLLANAAPPLDPEWDATHLIRAWAILRDGRIFSPWYRRTPEARIRRDLPDPETLHAGFVDFMRAGPEYFHLARAVWREDARPALDGLRVPALLTAAAADPARHRLDQVGALPANVTVEPLPETADEESALAARIRAFLVEDASDAVAPDPPPAVLSEPGAVRRDYVRTDAGEILARRSGAAGNGRPLVMFHPAPTSSLGFEPLLLALGTDRPVITFDMPGNGDSDPPPGFPMAWDIAGVLGQALDALGLDEYDVLGAHTGALIASELAIARPDRVRHLIMNGFPLFTDEERPGLLANFPFDLEIRSDGSHLLRLWHHPRDMRLWWPWWERDVRHARTGEALPGPGAQHSYFVEFVKGRTAYRPQSTARAAFTHPARDRLPLVRTKTLLCTDHFDQFRGNLAEGARLIPGSRVRILEAAGRTLLDAAPGGISPGLARTVDLYRRFLADGELADTVS